MSINARLHGHRLPRSVLLAMGPDLVLRRERDFTADCRATVRKLPARPTVSGEEHVPAHGPFALVANHYEGPGLWIGWEAALLTAVVARVRPARAAVRWLVIGQMDPGRVDGPKRYLPRTDELFRRVAHTWGMVPIPRPEAPPSARAAALRRLVRLAAPLPLGEGSPVGFFPEGEGDGFGGLRPPLPGTGELVALLGRRGVPALPAAVWHDGERLRAAFGPTFITTARDDAAVRAGTMERIAALLPAELRGPYAPAPAH